MVNGFSFVRQFVVVFRGAHLSQAPYLHYHFRRLVVLHVQFEYRYLILKCFIEEQKNNF